MSDLRALLEAATPGPWEANEWPVETTGSVPRPCIDANLNGFVTPLFAAEECGLAEDAALIVAAVNSLPHLLDVVEAAREYEETSNWMPVRAALSALDEHERA